MGKNEVREKEWLTMDYNAYIDRNGLIWVASVLKGKNGVRITMNMVPSFPAGVHELSPRGLRLVFLQDPSLFW
eukprot:1150034-Pelagomonas_calceolata.AAC.6